MLRNATAAAAIAAGATLVLAGAALAADPIQAKLATVAPEGTPWADTLASFKKQVEAESGGKLKIKPFMGGSLGDENATAGETKRGTIQIWGGSTAALADAVPELGLLELPYLFRSEAEADHVLDKILYDDLKARMAERGFVLLFWAENGYRSFGTNYGFVKAPAVLKGHKMRSQQADIHLEMYRALGASPVPIAVTEVISALSTGVIDGFDNTPLYAQAASWQKGITHYTVTKHIYQPAAVVASKKWFDGLPPEVQQALTAHGAELAVSGRKGVRAITPFLLQNFRNQKIEVYEPTPEELDAFAKATEPVYEKWMKGKGKRARPLVVKARQALAGFRAGKQ